MLGSVGARSTEKSEKFLLKKEKTPSIMILDVKYEIFRFKNFSPVYLAEIYATIDTNGKDAIC